MKNSLELPRSFEDMTIKQLRNIAKADLPDIQMIQRFTGLRSDQLRLIPYELIEKGAEHLRKLKANPIERHQDVVKIQGREYGFIPHWDDLSTGEYIDLMQMVDDPIENGSKIMSILFRPITERLGETYEIEAYKDLDPKTWDDISAARLYGALVFFSTIRTSYKGDSLRYGVKKGRKILQNLGHQKRRREDSERDTETGGINFWSRWRKAISRRFKR